MKPEREVLLDEAIILAKEIERHCPCGARPESLHTHPHVISCPVDHLLKNLRKIAGMLVMRSEDFPTFRLSPEEIAMADTEDDFDLNSYMRRLT